MKKIALLAIVLVLVFQSALQAQEREPLAMRIMLDWSVGGAFAGALVGAAIWLTDPGKEGNRLSDQVAGGAAWGAVGGAAFALSVMNDTSLAPNTAWLAPDPLHDSRRITADPIAAEERRQDLLTSAGSRGGGGKMIIIPVLALRF